MTNLNKIDFNTLENAVVKAKNNDNEAKEYIINIFMPFILKTSNNVFINDLDKDDIMQELTISLLTAIIKYKGDKSFFWYAIRTMKNNIYYLLRKYKKYDNNITLDNVVLLSNEEIDKDLLLKEDYNSLCKYLHNLKKDEYDIIFKSFFLEYSYDELMKDTNLKYNNIAYKKHTALKKLKKNMSSLVIN